MIKERCKIVFEKKKYIKPEIEVQHFIPNEFCSVCEDIYPMFRCNVAYDRHGIFSEEKNIAYDVKIDSNRNGSADFNERWLPGDAHGCSHVWHNVPADKVFTGWVRSWNGIIPTGVTEVKVYNPTGEDRPNASKVHCMFKTDDPNFSPSHS